MPKGRWITDRMVEKIVDVCRCEIQYLFAAVSKSKCRSFVR